MLVSLRASSGWRAVLVELARAAGWLAGAGYAAVLSRVTRATRSAVSRFARAAVQSGPALLTMAPSNLGLVIIGQ